VTRDSSSRGNTGATGPSDAGGANAITSGRTAAGGCAARNASSFRGPAYSGGSSRKVYSRTRRPFAQFSSTSMSRNGSLIGCPDVRIITYWPLGRR